MQEIQGTLITIYGKVICILIYYINVKNTHYSTIKYFQRWLKFLHSTVCKHCCRHTHEHLCVCMYERESGSPCCCFMYKPLVHWTLILPSNDLFGYCTKGSHLLRESGAAVDTLNLSWSITLNLSHWTRHVCTSCVSNCQRLKRLA